MAFEKAYIPYGAYWSSPFARWQGAFAQNHAMELAAETAKTVLEARNIPGEVLDGVLLGITVPQKHSFYGAPWLSGMLGAPAVGGQTVSQACATSARLVANAALEVEMGFARSLLAVACDRTSNGPHVYYPNPGGPGGMGDSENPVWDNFGHDPWAKKSMVMAGENVARAEGITREEQDAMTFLRYRQYSDALSDDRAFQRRYMATVELRRGKRVTGTVDTDEGVHPTTEEGLAKLRTVVEDGTITFGTQTHPADGNAGIFVCNREQAAALSKDKSVEISVVSYGEARVGKAMMPKAVVPAARAALDRAGITIEGCAAIKTHNPFAVNDVLFCREFDLAPESVNRFGSPLIWGHPQAPTGLRAIIELIEELEIAGGGYGLFSGCAAGDTAMAVVIRVG